MISIDLVDETDGVSELQMKEIESLLQHAAKIENINGEGELSVTFVDNERIREINYEYRDKNQPTDVLSFAMEELGEGEIEVIGMDMPRILGDIIISVPKAKEQAEEYAHSYERELGFLAIHGFLHLLGYDHMTAEEEQVMTNKQKEILDSYGLSRE